MAKFKDLNIELQDNQKLKLGTAAVWFDGNKLVIDGDVTITGSVSGSNMSRVHAYLTTEQTIGGVDFHLVELDAVVFDSLGEFNTGTHKFTASAEGYYTVTASLEINGLADGNYLSINIDINGSSSAVFHDEVGGATVARNNVTKLFHLYEGDTVHFDCRHGNAGNLDIGGGAAYTFLSIHRLS